MRPPDAERPPGWKPAAAHSSLLGAKSGTDTTPRCPIACGTEQCPWRCPVSLDDALTDLAFDLLAGAR